MNSTVSAAEERMNQARRDPGGPAVPRARRVSVPVAALVLLTSFSIAWAAAPGPKQKRFETPEDAVQGLIDAVRTGDTRSIVEVLGPSSGPLVSSGDKVEDQRARNAFVRAYEAAHRLEAGGGKVVLYVGTDNFPFPIPVVPDGPSWRFDTPAGQEEILNRRIGRNELNAMQVCLAYVDAQREYYAQERKQGEVLEYAQRLASAPGKRDGLYWDTRPGDKPSPFGPLVAKARSEGYDAQSRQGLEPYHGYFYRILTGQGPDAPGGASEYIARGHMIGGFGLVAYPAQYGASGVMTFIVNHDGVVYQKDLGAKTPTLARQMKLFDPDKTWQKVAPN